MPRLFVLAFGLLLSLSGSLEAAWSSAVGVLVRVHDGFKSMGGLLTLAVNPSTTDRTAWGDLEVAHRTDADRVLTARAA